MRPLPTWLLTRLVVPFLPSEHPWKGRRFTLADWRRGQTALCRMFDKVLWVLGVWYLLVLFLYLWATI